jgi:Ni,Fe-hydrogenase I small subunit
MVWIPSHVHPPDRRNVAESKGLPASDLRKLAIGRCATRHELQRQQPEHHDRQRRTAVYDDAKDRPVAYLAGCPAWVMQNLATAMFQT